MRPADHQFEVTTAGSDQPGGEGVFVTTVARNAPPPASPKGASARALRWRRRILMNLARLAIVAVLLGAWEWGVNAGHIDPFFWGQPSQVWATLRTWISVGTDHGSLAEQISVTLQEAVYGFLIASSACSSTRSRAPGKSTAI